MYVLDVTAEKRVLLRWDQWQLKARINPRKSRVHYTSKLETVVATTEIESKAMRTGLMRLISLKRVTAGGSVLSDFAVKHEKRIVAAGRTIR